MTTTYDPTSLFAGDLDVLSRSITLASGQNLVRGAVLGRITASGKYVLSASAAADGSQVPRAILATDCDASAADKAAPSYFSGAFAAEKLTFGAGHNQASVDLAFEQAGVLMTVRKVGADA